MYKSKKIIVFFMAVLLTFMIAIVPVFAAEQTPVSGSSGTANQNEITFTYDSPDHPWTDEELTKVKQRVSTLYSLIKSIYGEPAFNITVNIEKDSDGSYIGEYTPQTKKIRLYNPDRYDVLCHEMIHAFHDEYNLEAGLEEGMARAVEIEVLKQVENGEALGNTTHQYPFDVYYEGLNKESLGGNVFENPYNSFMKYELIGYAWAKMYYENPKFFIDFNKAYYQECRSNPNIKNSESDIKRIAESVQPSVESTPLGIWFKRQGCMDQTPPPGNFIYQRYYYYNENSPLSITAECFSRTNAGYVKIAPGISVNWAVYDYNNNIIQSGQGITDKYGYLCVDVKITPGYYGRIKLVASTDAFTENVSDTCFISVPKKSDYTYDNGSVQIHSNNGVFGVTPSTNQGTISFYYPSGSAGPIASVPVIDGAFYAPELQSIQGKIRAVYEDGLGQRFEKYFTKDACDYFLLMTPNIPTDLCAKNEADTNILSWTAVDNAQAYNIKRSLTVGGEYVTIASNITGNSYVDETSNGNAQYYYKVSAVSCGNESADSLVLKVESSQKPKTKIILESSANPGEPWKAVTFKAKVVIDSDNPADQNVHPTGKVIFRQDGYDIPSGSVDLIDGVATYTINYIDMFPYEVSAEFQSDKYLGSSESLIQCFKRSTATKLIITPVSGDSSPNPEKFIIKATVSISDEGYLENGIITIKDGENVLGTQNISGDNGSYYNQKPFYEFVLESPLSPGTHQITAEYEDTDTSIFGTYAGSRDTVSLEVKTPPASDDSPIASIDNLEASAYQNTSYNLPEKVTAVTEKGGTREVAVSWNPSYVSTSLPGTYTFKGTVDGYPNGVLLTLTVKPEISSIAYCNTNASVFQNTPYTLPATITANMSDGSKQQVPILWENQNVDTSKTGRFTFVGSVEGYTGSKVTITLDVRAPIESISDINASVFIDAPYTLPSTVTAKLADGLYLGPLKVIWSPSSVDTKNIGTYTFKGTVDGYNGNVTLTLTVKPKILSIAYYNINASAYQNTPYTLPATITANMSDGTQQQVPIQWENPNVDTSQTGRFTFVGSVEGYTGSKVTITLDVHATIASINNLNATVIQNQPYLLPETVTAKLTNGWYLGPLQVVWSVSAVDTSIPGVYTYEGTVEGYSKKVVLTLTVTAERI